MKSIWLLLQKAECVLLDGAASSVRVHGADRADGHAHCGVLLHLHQVAALVEQRRLVHVLHGDAHSGHVLGGAGRGEARVRVGVLHLDLHRVGRLLLVVHRLAEGKTR